MDVIAFKADIREKVERARQEKSKSIPSPLGGMKQENKAKEVCCIWPS